MALGAGCGMDHGFKFSGCRHMRASWQRLQVLSFSYWCRCFLWLTGQRAPFPHRALTQLQPFSTVGLVCEAFVRQYAGCWLGQSAWLE